MTVAAGCDPMAERSGRAGAATWRWGCVVSSADGSAGGGNHRRVRALGLLGAVAPDIEALRGGGWRVKVVL
jgi:hypothetical protein